MKHKILVVDDEEMIVKTLSIRLNNAGYETTCAKDGLEAVKKAQQESPDLIILDIMMPHLDGMQTSEKLKASSLTKNIPIIFLTALQTKEGEKLNTNINTVLAKPIDSEKLLRLIKQKLEE